MTGARVSDARYSLLYSLELVGGLFVYTCKSHKTFQIQQKRSNNSLVPLFQMRDSVMVCVDVDKKLRF